MKRKPIGKSAVWLDDFEMEILGAYLAELMEKQGTPAYALAVLSNAYEQLTGEAVE